MKAHLRGESVSEHLAERIAIVPLLFAVVLGASLIEFHGFFFPPRVSRMEFWALSIAYLAALASWFGWHEAAYRYPYTRQPIARLRAGLEAMVAVSWAALLFMASEASKSLVGYLWGFVVTFGLHALVIVVRRLEWGAAEAGYQPLRPTVIHGAVIAGAAAIYTGWVLMRVPLPGVAAWIFLFLPLGVVVSYRWPQMLRQLPQSVLEEQSPGPKRGRDTE